MVEVSLTVGKLDALLALLLTKDHHMIEFPTILLPNGVRAGSIVKIRCDQDVESEQAEAARFQKVQDEILDTFGKNVPKAPVLTVKNTTQTSCILEWQPLDLGMATLKNLVLYKDGRKLGAIPQPTVNRTTKLSGLPIDKTFQFQLRLDTTAGVYQSQLVEVTTHKMTDLSGITICLGDIAPNDPFTAGDINAALANMGAHHPAQTLVQVDTTHFVCTRENKQNPEFVRAGDMNIPIIRPEWLKACERERRIVGVRDFYVKDCVLPDIFAKNYWDDGKKGERVTSETNVPKEEPSSGTSAPATAQDVAETGAPLAAGAESQVAPSSSETAQPSGPTPELAVPQDQDSEVTQRAEVPESAPVGSEPANITKPLPSEPVEPVQEPLEEPVQESVEEPFEEPVQKSVQEPAQEPIQESVQASVQEPSEQQTDQVPVSSEPISELAQPEEAGNGATLLFNDVVGTDGPKVEDSTVINESTAEDGPKVEDSTVTNESTAEDALEPETEEKDEDPATADGTPEPEGKKKKKKNKKKGKK